MVATAQSRNLICFHLHFTPAYASWLSLVEHWFAVLTNGKLRHSTHRSDKELEADVNNWIAGWNESPKPFVWTKTADEIWKPSPATSPNVLNRSATQDTSGSARKVSQG